MRPLIALAVALMVSCGPAVASAKTLYSPILGTANDTDTFHCAFLNIHTKKAAGVSFYIFDFQAGEIVGETSFILQPGEAVGFFVNGPGVFMCVSETSGGKVQSQVSLGADGRYDEVQRVQ